MKINLKYPSPQLADYINFYWGIESDSNEFIPEQLIYPEGTTELMFHYGKPFISKDLQNRKIVHSKVLLCGQKTQSTKVISEENIGMFAVNFKPFGASAFFNLPYFELKNSNIDAELFIGNSVNLLLEQIAECVSFETRVNTIETYLQKTKVSIREHELERLSFAFQKLKSEVQSFKVEQLADCACVSFKTLDRLFHKRVGLSPKEYLKIERLKRALETMKSNKSLNLTEIAYAHGYFDQSHFNKDFANIVGISPKEFVRLLNSDPVCLEK